MLTEGAALLSVISERGATIAGSMVGSNVECSVGDTGASEVVRRAALSLMCPSLLLTMVVEGGIVDADGG